MTWEYPLEKAIGDIGPGIPAPEFGPTAHEYSHLLTPEHERMMPNARVIVYKSPTSDKIETSLRDTSGFAIAHVQSQLHPPDPMGRVAISINSADSHEHIPYQVGKGMHWGRILYEANMAYAKEHLGATHVIGGAHSTFASKAHQGIAEKHGLNYVPSPNIRGYEEFDPSLAQHHGIKAIGQYTDDKEYDEEGEHPYDAKFGPYQYTIKSEDPASFANIPPGKLKRTSDEEGVPYAQYWDYSHLLSPEQRGHGYELELKTVHHGALDSPPRRWQLFITHPDAPGMVYGNMKPSVGEVNGVFGDNGLNKAIRFSYAKIKPEHRGKHLGRAAYEAVIAHFKNNHGAQMVVGGHHSTSANITHKAITNKYGIALHDPPIPAHSQDWESDEPIPPPSYGSFDNAFGPYAYGLGKKEMEIGVPLLKIEEDQTDPVIASMMDTTRYINEYDLWRKIRSPEWNENRMAVLLKYRPNIVQHYGRDELYANPLFTKAVWDHGFKGPDGKLAQLSTAGANAHRDMLYDFACADHITKPAWATSVIDLYKETLEQAEWDATNEDKVPKEAPDTTADTLMGYAMGSPRRANQGDMTGDATGTLLEDPFIQKTLPLTHKVGTRGYRGSIVATLTRLVNSGTLVGDELRIKLLDYTKDLVSNLERFTSTSTQNYRNVKNEVSEILPSITSMVQGHVPEAYIKKNTTKKGLFTALLTHAPQFPKRKFDKLMEALAAPDAKKFKLKAVEEHVSRLLMASPHIEDNHWAEMIKAFPGTLTLDTVGDPRWTEELSRVLWDKRKDTAVMDMLSEKGKLTPSLIEHIASGIGSFDNEVQAGIDRKVAEYDASMTAGENKYVKDSTTGRFASARYGNSVDIYGDNPYEYSTDTAEALAGNMRIASVPEATASNVLHNLLNTWEKSFFFTHHAGLTPGAGKRDTSMARHPWELAKAYGHNLPADVNTRLVDLMLKHTMLSQPNQNDAQNEWLNKQGDDVVKQLLAKSTKSEVLASLLIRRDAKPEWLDTVIARPEFNTAPTELDPRFSPHPQNSWRNTDPQSRDHYADFKNNLRSAVFQSPGLGDVQIATLLSTAHAGEMDTLAGHTNFGPIALNALMNSKPPLFSPTQLTKPNGVEIYDDNGDPVHEVIRPGDIKVAERAKAYALMNVWGQHKELFTDDVWNTLMATGQLEPTCGQGNGGISNNPFVNNISANSDIPVPQAVVDHLWNGGLAARPSPTIRSNLLSHKQARPEWVDAAINGTYDPDTWNTLLDNSALSDTQLAKMVEKGPLSCKRIIKHENFGPEGLGAIMAFDPTSTVRPAALAQVVDTKNDLLTPDVWAKLESEGAFSERHTDENGRHSANPLLAAAIKAPNVPQTVLDSAWEGTDMRTKSKLLAHAKARPEWIEGAITTFENPPPGIPQDSSLLKAILANPTLNDDQVGRVIKGIEKNSGTFIDDNGAPTDLGRFQRNGLPEAWAILSQSAYGQGDWMMNIGKKMRAYDKERVALGESKVWDTGHYRTPPFVKDAMKAVELNDPDAFFREEGIPHSYVQVHPGSQMIRAVRDLIAKNGAPVHMSQLPPGPDYNRYQMTAPMSDEQWAKVPEKQKAKTNGIRPSKKTGLVSVENMEQAIKDMGDDPLHNYIVSHANYGPGTQSDSQNIPDEVFQLNVSTAKVKALKAAGVWGLFLRVQKAVHAGGGSHPSRSGGLGWFRHRNVTPQNTMHITEQQSDIRPHGHSWSYFWNQFKGGSARTGNTPQFMSAFTSIFDDTNFPGKQLDTMHNILFGVKTDPATVMIDALHQHLRDKGHHDVTIYTPASEWRAKLSYSPSRDKGTEKTLEDLGRRRAPTPEEAAKGRPGALENNVDVWVPEHNNGGWHKLHDVNLQTREIKFGIDRNTLKLDPDRKLLARPPSEIPIHIRRVYDDAFKDAGYSMRAAPYGEEPTQTGSDYHGQSLKGGIEDRFHTSKVRKYEDIWGQPLNKGIGSLPDLPLMESYRNERVYDGNDFLTQEHKDAGYGMAIRSGVTRDSMPWVVADILHHDQFVGGTTASVGDTHIKDGKEVKPLSFDISDIDYDHTGKGLGLAMYEAVMAHSRGLFGVTHVIGGKHSTMAHRLHQKIAEKHGLKYSASPNIQPSGMYPNEKEWQDAAATPYDNKFGSYKYTIDPHVDEYDEPSGNAPLGKMALGNIPVGRTMPKDYPGQENQEFLYSHLLPASYRKQGYRIRLSQSGARAYGDDEPTVKHELHASIERRVPVNPEHAAYVRQRADQLYQRSPQEHAAFVRRHSFVTESIGNAHGYIHNDGALEPHFNSGIKEIHRGQGLGKALYNSLFGHAYNTLGVRTVRGQLHSVPAGRIHEALSREHGMAYDADNITTPKKYQENRHLEGAPEVRTAYNYALKSESSAIPR